MANNNVTITSTTTGFMSNNNWTLISTTSEFMPNNNLTLISTTSGFMSNNNGKESSGSAENPQVPQNAPFFGSFSLTAPVFLVPSSSSSINLSNNPNTNSQPKQLRQIFSNGQSSGQSSSHASALSLHSQALDLQALSSTLATQQVQKTMPVPLYQGNIINPVALKPGGINPTGSSSRRSKGKSILKPKPKPSPKYSPPKLPMLPPQLTSANFPNLTSESLAVGKLMFPRGRKDLPREVINPPKVETKDSSSQTSGWKFMSEIGTIEAMKEKNKNRDKHASKSTIIATLRDVYRRFKQKIETSESADSHGHLMESIVEDFQRWLKQQHVEKNTCLLCEQSFVNEKAVQQHLVSGCVVLRTVFTETVVGTPILSLPDASTMDEHKEQTLPDASIIQSLLSKNYLHGNSAQNLKRRCMFCGEIVKQKEVVQTDMYLDKRHLFDSCVVFRNFLVFHDKSYTLSTSQKVGTSWTFQYYYCLLNYYAMNFQHDIHDLRFLQEDKAHYIVQIMESITDSIIHRAPECPLCYSKITNRAVLQHHISFALCPFLLKFYKDMRAHVDTVWRVPGQIESLRTISTCFQYFMSFQCAARPIMIKQSILPDNLAYKLLENAMYFKSLDSSFNLQFYKAPKEVAIAMKIEEQQQKWAEEVLQCKSSDVATECPFCFTTFNTERNLVKHIVYISCKSIRPVCQQIYNLLEYCEWDVQNPVAIITQHSCYIIKQAVLRGEFEINLLKEQLTEYITIVTAKFLNFNLTDRIKSILFDSTEESVVEPALSYDENNLFQEFFSWAKRVIRKKNGAVCPLCGQDKGYASILINHLALGACPYLKQFLLVMDEIYQFNHLFRPCATPNAILISKNRSITFDFVHHIRKCLFLFKGSTKCTQFFDHDEFEAFLLNSPQNYIKHTNLMSLVIGDDSTTCSFCFMDFKSQDHLLLHLLFFRCPTVMFVIDLVKNEWNKCCKGLAKTEKMLEVIKIYSSMFELDPCTVISSGDMKKYFNENNNMAMLNNFKLLQSWAQAMFTHDPRSNLNICNACNVAAENIERHLWLEEPVDNFCPQIKSYLDFHRKMVCKKNNRGDIRASFTVTDLFEIKRFVQAQYSHLHKNTETDEFNKQSIISPSLRKQIKTAINTTLKIYPRYDGTMESFRLMFGTSPAFLFNQLAIADKIAVSKMCFLCDIMFQSVEDVRFHVATFECRVLQSMLLHVKNQDQIDEEVVHGELINAYKRTVAYCRELYPNLHEGNLLLVMESVDSQCHSKLYNFIMSKIPRSNPYKCAFCSEDFPSMGEIYSHFKKIQCLGLRDCFGFIPNKGPIGPKHPFLQAVYNIFLNCYNTFGMRSQSKLKSLLVGVNNLADSYEFWCSNYCDSLVPKCPFCSTDLLSVSMIKSHPMTCPKLRETNLEVFRSDRLADSSFMKQQGLGSCKLTGELPREVLKESEGVPFMQRYRCSQYLGWIPLCLDCATSSSCTADEETCRFLWFRRLVKKDSRLFVFDFESSQTVAKVSSWVPARNSVLELKVDSAKYILRHLLPHFNQLMGFELWELENVPNIRLKHQVKNVRELCDTCTTTLFNIHLFCPRCGYVICMDCYRDRLAGLVSSGLADCSDGSVHNLTSLETCVTIPPRAVKQLCSAVEAVKDLHCISVTDLPFTRCPTADVPHTLICNGQVLALTSPDNANNVDLFSKFHQKGNAVVVYGLVDKSDKSLWSPESFSKHFGSERELVINTSTLEVHRISLKDFFDGFSNVNERPRNENGDPMVLKLKDWPTTWDFKEKLPQWYDDFMKVIPLKAYTQRTGIFNIARYLPNIYCSPDLGPKMYIAYSNANNPNEGSTVLHIDISDAVNIIMYVGSSQDVVITYDDDGGTKSDSSFLKRKVYTLKEICEDTDEKQLERIRRRRCKIGALWHIYHPNDIDKIRHFIHKVLNESGQTLPSGHDPIHDQAMYLDKNMRKRLFQEYGVRGWPIVQCEGEAVFIPAGAPHQVRNLQSCIKIAEDYVSPERVSFCLKHTQEIRHLSKQHSNQEDKLQIKNLLYHGVKECVSVLQNNIPSKDLCTCKPVETNTTSTQFSAPSAQDQRDLMIERLQAELETVRKNSTRYKEIAVAKEADYSKAKKCYEVERQANKDLRTKLSKMRKQQEDQASQSFVKVLPVPYQTSFSSRPHDIQKPEARVQELRKPEARHPRDTRHSDSGKRSEPHSLGSRMSDSLLKDLKTASHSDLKRSQFSNFEPADYRRASSSHNSSSHSSSSLPSTSNSRDPRLKPKVPESEPETASTANVWNSSRHLNPRPGVVVPKSAFQGVQHAVQDLRTKKPPPQKMRKTPETPEPMDTNQDSCSPNPAGMFADGPKNNLEMLSAVSAVQPRSYPTNRVYDQGASNSETDSNEEAINPQYAGNFTPTPPASKAAVIPGPFSSPSVSPGFNPRSLNLQISSPKQPAIFSKQNHSGSGKGKEESTRKPKQEGNKPSSLSEIFPLQPSYSNNYPNTKQAIMKKDIKPELRTPPSERVNPPTFAPHLASYLPDMLARDRNSWSSGPRKTVSSPVTPTISPAVTSHVGVTSPATPPPSQLAQQSASFSTPPQSRPADMAPKMEPQQQQQQQSSCVMQESLTTNPLVRPPNTFNMDVRRAAIPVTPIPGPAPGVSGLGPEALRVRSKSNESYASLTSSSPDIPDPQQMASIQGQKQGSSTVEPVVSAYVQSNPAEGQNVSRDPRITRRRSSETKQEKHQDETVTSSNEASSNNQGAPKIPASSSSIASPSQVSQAPITSEAKVTSTTTPSAKETYTEEQKRMYCPPEPEKLIIFDEQLLTRLTKKRTQVPAEGSQTATTSGVGGLKTSGLVNPLLRKKHTQLPPSPSKQPRKPHLTDTVDAILKSDKAPPPRVSPTTEPPAPPFETTAVVSRYEDIVNPVLVALSGINGSAKRSRESSGNSVSSLSNMPVLSPISPASTPPIIPEVVQPPPLPPGSPPREQTPPAPPPPPEPVPAVSETKLSTLTHPEKEQSPAPNPQHLPASNPLYLPASNPLHLPNNPPSSVDSVEKPLPETPASPTPRKRKCSRSSSAKKRSTDESDTALTISMLSSHEEHPSRRLGSSVENKEPGETRTRRRSERSSRLDKKRKQSDNTRSRSSDKERPKVSSSESKRSSSDVYLDRPHNLRTPSPSSPNKGKKKRSGSSSSSRSKSKRRPNRSSSSSKRDDLRASPSQNRSRDTAQESDKRHSENEASSSDKRRRKNSASSPEKRHSSRDSEKRHSRGRSADEMRHRRKDESLPERRSRSNSSERIVRYHERQSPVFTRTVNITRDCQTESISHKRKSRRRK